MSNEVKELVDRDVDSEGLAAPNAGRRRMKLVAGLDERQLDRTCRRLQREGEVGQRALAFYLNDMEGRRIFQLLGFGSTIHYAKARLGLEQSRAQKLLEAGRALQNLPVIDQAFAEGGIAWTRVRLLVRIATPATEAEWLEVARRESWKELERLVATAKAGARPRANGLGIPAVRMRIIGHVDAMAHEIWRKAKAKLESERGETLNDGEVMRTLALLALATRPEGSIEGRERDPVAPFRIVILKGRDDALPELATGDGLVRIDAAAVAAVEGMAEIETITPADLLLTATSSSSTDTEPPKTPAWMRELVLARDAYRCRHCQAETDLHVHHIVFRSQGGRTTPENLVTVDTSCHALIHEGLVRIEGTPSAGLRFVDRDGESLDATAPATEGPILEVVPGVVAEPGAADGLPAPIPELPGVVDAGWWRRHIASFSWNERRGLFEFRAGAAVVEDEPATESEVGGAIPLARIVGQTRAVATLLDAAAAARKTGTAASHVLLSGAAGLGKSCLAAAYAAEIGKGLHQTSASLLDDVGALIGLLARLRSGAVLFLDEIHALPRRVAETLYEALQERRLSLVVAVGPQIRTLRLELDPFTLVGATTDDDRVPAPLRMRFPLRESLEFYDAKALSGIVAAAANAQGLQLSPAAASLIAGAGRDTPREALAMLTRIRNAALASDLTTVDANLARSILTRAAIDTEGLNAIDRRILDAIREGGSARPVGLARLAASLGLSPSVVRDVHEPFLFRRGLLGTTTRGRFARA